MLKSTILIILSLSFALLSQGQCVLKLTTPRAANSKIVDMSRVDAISIKLTDSARTRFDGLKKLEARAMFDCENQAFVLDQYGRVYIHEIEKLSLVKGGFFRVGSMFFKYGGRFYAFINTFNRLINNDGPIIDKSTLIIFPTAEVTGRLLERLKYRYFHSDKSKAKYFELKDISPN